MFTPPFDPDTPREEKMFQWLRDTANFDVGSNVNDLSLIALLVSAITVAALTV